MASPAQPIAIPRPPQPLRTLTDDLLEEIFLRLPTPTDLARACTACASFRRIITDRSFLRRFRAIHPPPPLGFLPHEEAGFLPAQPPHPSTPLARALADAADFSYSFVPTGRWRTPWRTRDVRQGRVLIECCPEDALDHPSLDMRPVDLVLAVCDPIYRRYVLLPTIPADLAVPDRRKCFYDFGLFLVPTGEDEEETSFRVMCTVSNDTNLVAFLYSSATGHWCIVASSSFSSLGTCPPRGVGFFSCFEYSHGCFFWTGPWREKLLVLDTLRMEFSILQNVPYSCRKLDTGQPCIVVGTEGSPEMLLLNNSFDVLHFRVTKQTGNVPSDKWQLQNVIPLPSKYYYYLTLGAAEGFLFLRCIPETQRLAHSSEDLVDDYCLLDIKTSELKKVCGMPMRLFRVHAYFGFPPSLSKPSI